jgi:hypothetical protein
MEKQRRYYTKKIQETREKHEGQMRAVRSGRPNSVGGDGGECTRLALLGWLF